MKQSITFIGRIKAEWQAKHFADEHGFRGYRGTHLQKWQVFIEINQKKVNTTVKDIQAETEKPLDLPQKKQ